MGVMRLIVSGNRGVGGNRRIVVFVGLRGGGLEGMCRGGSGGRGSVDRENGG